jgi:ATP-dependent Lhr-like helicase
MNVGVILSDAAVEVRFQHGRRLGQVEESFVARLKPGDRFTFAGRDLEFLRIREQVATVRLSKGRKASVPVWMGGRMPLSSRLSAAVRRTVGRSREEAGEQPELAAVRPLLDVQTERSRLPGEGELLAEVWDDREGSHLCLYPFEGRSVHEGLAALLALRLSRRERASFSLAVNDYGFEILHPESFDFEAALDADLLSPGDLAADIADAVNLGEMAKRRFREVARVAGLVPQNLPRASRTARQLQASASLLYGVFERYDPENLLLLQARREVYEREFERGRLMETLDRLAGSRLRVERLARPSPFAFPLVVDRLRARISSERLEETVERLKRQCRRADRSSR